MPVIKAVFEDGVFKPEEPVQLPEHTRVEVVVSAPAALVTDDPTGWKAMRELIGLAGDADQSDGNAAENHDEVLYGRRR